MREPLANIAVSQDSVSGDVTVSLEFTTPDGVVGVTWPLEEAAGFAYALHEACKVGMDAQGGLKESGLFLLEGGLT